VALTENCSEKKVHNYREHEVGEVVPQKEGLLYDEKVDGYGKGREKGE
jgi:hypothetical protein